MGILQKCFITGNRIEKGDRHLIILSSGGYSELTSRERSIIKQFRWLAFLIVPYFQMIIYFASKHRRVVEIDTAAGEMEIDNFSKKSNLIEGVAFEVLVLVAIWVFVYYFGMINGITSLGYFGYALLGFSGVYILFISPYLHRDLWHRLGLGEPFEIVSILKSGTTAQRKKTIALVFAVGSIHILMTLPNWGYVLIKMGVRVRNPDLYTYLTTTAAGTVVAFMAGVFSFLILALFFIRWDNFISSSRALILFGGIFSLAIVVTGAIYASINNDWSKFESFVWASSDPDNFISRASFYIIWGMVQQFLFLSYFNSRFRKGFKNTKSGKFVSALLTGLCFGLIHLPFLPLSILTFIGGFAYGCFFPRDKYANLFIMGVAHGVAGTLVSMLTPIEMSVGPWAI